MSQHGKVWATKACRLCASSSYASTVLPAEVDLLTCKATPSALSWGDRPEVPRVHRGGVERQRRGRWEGEREALPGEVQPFQDALPHLFYLGSLLSLQVKRSMWKCDLQGSSWIRMDREEWHRGCCAVSSYLSVNSLLSSTCLQNENTTARAKLQKKLIKNKIPLNLKNKNEFLLSEQILRWEPLTPRAVNATGNLVLKINS